MPAKRLDISGQKFNRLTAVGPTMEKHRGYMLWEFLCDCGRTAKALAAKVKSGDVQSCGCLLKTRRIGIEDLTSRRFYKLTAIEFVEKRHSDDYWRFRCECSKECTLRVSHVLSGHTKTCGCRKFSSTSRKKEPLAYKSWSSMLLRCYNPKNDNYRFYGGKGVIVCDRWRESFELFLEDMGPRMSRDLTLDRIDGSKGYYPGNCRWSTKSEQSNNCSNNFKVKYGDRLYTLRELSNISGITYRILYGRIITNNWNIEKALSVKPKNREIRHV